MVDVAVSIATCVREVSRANPTLGFLQLTRSGFELGCAELGTMTSTLLLAYMGVNIFLLMLYAAKATPMVVILNNGVISHEILRPWRAASAWFSPHRSPPSWPAFSTVPGTTADNSSRS